MSDRFIYYLFTHLSYLLNPSHFQEHFSVCRDFFVTFYNLIVSEICVGITKVRITQFVLCGHLVGGGPFPKKQVPEGWGGGEYGQTLRPRDCPPLTGKISSILCLHTVVRSGFAGPGPARVTSREGSNSTTGKEVGLSRELRLLPSSTSTLVWEEPSEFGVKNRIRPVRCTTIPTQLVDP